MKKVFSIPKSLRKVVTHYCPGCGHFILHRLIAQAIDELGVQDRVIGVPPAGCAVLAYKYFDVDMGEAPHGRALAVATGLKRALPDGVVFTYQGDGDFAAIGTAEAVHAANRGELVTAFFVNNANYGMTGGQMAPTTLLGMTSTTSPRGRTAKLEGGPLNLTQMLKEAHGAVYLERVAVNSPKNIRRAAKAVKKAFEVQIKGLGFSLIEVLSPCPTNWKMDPVKACAWLEDNIMQYFPLGVIKDESGLGEGGKANDQ